jgi:hypothetical protein
VVLSTPPLVIFIAEPERRCATERALVAMLARSAMKSGHSGASVLRTKASSSSCRSARAS